MANGWRATLAERRRRYLAARAAAGTKGCIGVAIAGLFGLTTVICLLGFVGAFVSLSPRSSYPEGTPPTPLSAVLGLVAASAFTVSILGGLTFLGYKMLRSAEEEAANVEYVPPVREQIAALPAQEILVRGSQAESEPAGELLRSAHEPGGLDADELLRANVGGGAES